VIDVNIVEGSRHHQIFYQHTPFSQSCFALSCIYMASKNLRFFIEDRNRGPIREYFFFYEKLIFLYILNVLIFKIILKNYYFNLFQYKKYFKK